MAKSHRLASLAFLVGLYAVPVGATEPTKAPELPRALLKPAPEGIEDLRAIQTQTRSCVSKILPCTVNVRAGSGQGSGVIISADGYVLTAGHVSGAAGRDVQITLPDGKTIRGKTLGANRAIDSGLIQITDPGPWPFVEMGQSGDLKRGTWCVTTGHPNGYISGRPPVVRVGRVLEVTEDYLRTDCTLVGGDSGGPLFDMNGRVIGIHSRIGMFLTANLHVPVDTYRDTWKLLVKGEVWAGPWLGFKHDGDPNLCKVESVDKDSPAEKGGLAPEDVITRFDGRAIATFDVLKRLLARKKPGDEVEVQVKRGEETLTLKIVIGGRKPA